MGYIDTINNHKKLYLNSLNPDELKSAEPDVLSIYNLTNRPDYILPEIPKSAFELVVLLKTKRRLLTYFSTFTDEAYGYLYDGSKKIYVDKETSKYEEAYKLLFSVVKFAPDVKKIVDVIIDNKCILIDDAGNRVTSNVAICEKVITVCDELINSINNLSFDGFAENVKFVDYKKVLSDEVEALRSLANRCITDINDIEVKKIKEKVVVEFKMNYSFNNIYRPLPDFSKISNLVILNSPIIEEVNLFLEAYRRSSNATMYLMNANFLEKEKTENLRTIFEVIKMDSADLFVTNLYKYSGDNKEFLFKHLYEYAETGRKVFIYNNLIDENLYEYFVSLANNNQFIRTSRIGNHFVALPSYEEVISFLQRNHLNVTDEMLTNIKHELPYLGYEGLNSCLYDHSQGRNWYVRARKVSERNQSENPIDKYLGKISNQNQLISTDWGNFKENVHLNKTKHFDYDLINEINDKFVEEIMYSDLNLIEKCGVVIRYILTGGNDYKILADIPQRELEDRVTKATLLTMNLLGIEFKPEVLFKDVVGGKATILGQCCNHGKIIEYKNSACRSDEILTTLPHECYHAFQHMTANGYCNWFWDELFVSEARTKYWTENFNNYENSAKEFYVYYNQVVEADARTFADDCMAAADRLWHKFNFKK